MAFPLGWVMAPATEAVVAAVSPAKSGIASATNTVVRGVSGALGVTVVGSLISSLYASDLDGTLTDVPPGGREAVEGSVGAAGGVAAALPPEAGAHLLARTGEVSQAMGTGLVVAAAISAITAGLVAHLLRPSPPQP